MVACFRWTSSRQTDTLKGGVNMLELAKVLCENSGADVEWLTAVVKLDLSLAQLSGYLPQLPSGLLELNSFIR